MLFPMTRSFSFGVGYIFSSQLPKPDPIVSPRHATPAMHGHATPARVCPPFFHPCEYPCGLPYLLQIRPLSNAMEAHHISIDAGAATVPFPGIVVCSIGFSLIKPTLLEGDGDKSAHFLPMPPLHSSHAHVSFPSALAISSSQILSHRPHATADMCAHIHMYVYIYIYVFRYRYRYRQTCIYVYVCKYVPWPFVRRPASARFLRLFHVRPAASCVLCPPPLVPRPASCVPFPVPLPASDAKKTYTVSVD